MKRDVLVVDDDSTVRLVVEGVLGSEGWAVRTAADGLEALSLLDETTFDVVVADVDMPQLSGLELLQHVKSKSPTTVVIIMTGHPGRNGSLAALKQGADDYLAKPFDIDELVIKLRRLENPEAEISAADGMS